MADQIKNLAHKEQHGDEPPIKFPKIDTKETQPRSITNIYYDCLERIFDFLDLENLLNVAQTCKRLQTAAAAKFNDEYGKKAFSLTPKIPINNSEGFHVRYNGIHVIDLKFCLPFLRCFGSKVSTLYISCGNSDTANDHVDYYINQYCAETLTGISFTSKRLFLDGSFANSFKKVETARFMHSCLDQLPKFIDRFPNLRRLKIDGCTVNHSMPVIFPHLHHLRIELTCDLPVKGARKFLRANHHLQRLEFSFKNDITVTLSTVLDLINNNKKITRFMLEKSRNSVMDVNTAELLRLASEHPIIVELNLHSCLLEADDAIALMDQLNQLEWFRFRVTNLSEYDRLLMKLNSEWKHEFVREDDVGLITLFRWN